jgi:hypothetical protein
MTILQSGAILFDLIQFLDGTFLLFLEDILQLDQPQTRFFQEIET